MKTLASFLAFGMASLGGQPVEFACDGRCGSPDHASFSVNAVPRDDPNSVEGEDPPADDGVTDPPADDSGDDGT